MAKDLMTMGGKKVQELLAALVKQEPGWLDRPIEDVVRMIDIGGIWLQNEHKVQKRIKGTDLAVVSDYWKSRLETAKNGARGYFIAMDKIGEVYDDAGDGAGRPKKNSLESERNMTKRETMEAIGLAQKKGWEASLIHNNPDLVEVAFANSEAENDFPSLTDFIVLAGKIAGRSRTKGKRQPTVQESANYIWKMLREINVLLSGVVENLDQVKATTAKEIHEALGRTVEIWTKKAPEEMKALGRRLT